MSLTVTDIDADESIDLALPATVALAMIQALSGSLLKLNGQPCGDPTCRSCYPLCDDCEGKIDNAKNN